MKVETFTLLDNMSNTDYHAKLSEEYHSFSSSQLKDILKSKKKFWEKHISSLKEETTIGSSLQSAYDIGTYFHTAILEPHLLEKECAVFNGTRRGGNWDKFKEDNKGKVILIQSGFNDATNLIKGVQRNELSQMVYQGGEAEVSLFVEYWVSKDGDIYLLTDKQNFVLTLSGWASLVPTKKLKKKDLTLIRVKVRCDYKNEEMGYIADLKSMSGDPTDEEAIENIIDKLQYELSAVLYMDAFNAQLLYSGKKAVYNDFIWTFATKECVLSKEWYMTTAQQYMGRAKVMEALKRLAEGIRDGWDFPETVDPAPIKSWQIKKWCPKLDISKLTTKSKTMDALMAKVLKIKNNCSEIDDI